MGIHSGLEEGMYSVKRSNHHQCNERHSAGSSVGGGGLVPNYIDDFNPSIVTPFRPPFMTAQG